MKSLVVFSFVLLFAAAPLATSAQTTPSFEISGWIPYWRSALGVESILPQLDTFTEVNPFMYTLKTDGTLHQAGQLTDAEWVNLARTARERGVRFIPTIMSGSPDVVHDILSDPEKRAAHVKAITTDVYRYRFDGIDIDYEGKYAKTRPYFSLFLKELEAAIGYDKWVMCTIESRTPLDSRYSSLEAIPKDIEYANDFSEINKYCDRVRIMAYDQERIDLKLNASNAHPYVPVADVAWVEKTMTLIAQEVAKDKLVIGVATYGYEYDMFADASGNTQYSRLWTFNPGYALGHASKLNIEPSRNSAGELFLTYPASQSPDPIIPLPYATRVMSWSDSEAIKQKIELAKRLGLRGISIFKIDGGQDPTLYSVLAQYPAAKSLVPPIVPESGDATTPSTPVAIPTRNLQTGSTGEDVRTLQKFLNANGYTVAGSGAAGSPGNETTRFGAATRAALIKLQKAKGITPAVGYYGPLTRATILKGM